MIHRKFLTSIFYSVCHSLYSFQHNLPKCESYGSLHKAIRPLAKTPEWNVRSTVFALPPTTTSHKGEQAISVPLSSATTGFGRISPNASVPVEHVGAFATGLLAWQSDVVAFYWRGPHWQYVSGWFSGAPSFAVFQIMLKWSMDIVLKFAMAHFYASFVQQCCKSQETCPNWT